MTRPEQPQPYPGDLIVSLPGTVHYRREYRDALGRPMRGRVTITGAARSEHDGVVTLPAPVVVDVADGILDVDLPPDTYTITAALRTRDGDRASETLKVALAA